jgi:diguanylate cyclase (GGDEF)-like protein
VKSKSTDSKHTIPAKSTSLGRVLKQSEKIKETVEEAAGELTSVNETLQQDNKGNVLVQTMKKAIALNEDAEHKVVKAADDLNQVNTQLAKEVTERADVDSDLADTKIDLADVREDLSKSQASEREAKKQSLQDPLTGLANRALFEQVLDHGLIQAKRHGWGLAVLFIDIDQFKSINDSYGHDLGDKVLLMVANRLQYSLREEDTVSRWGGDEFVCLLLEVKQEADVSRLAKKMVSRIAEACEFNGTVLSIKVSIGIAIYPADGKTADSLFKNADTAMYKAKGTKKRVVLFRESSLTDP